MSKRPQIKREVSVSSAFPPSAALGRGTIFLDVGSEDARQDVETFGKVYWEGNSCVLTVSSLYDFDEVLEYFQNYNEAS